MAEKFNSHLEKAYPEADQVFSFTYKNASEIKDNCIYVLDTNVLLVPFDVNKENLEDIKNILIQLKTQKRLFIPAQVAREFAPNRAKRIENVYKKISSIEKNLNTGNFTINTPFLQAIDAFKELQSYLEQIRQLIDKSRNEVKKIVDYIQHWNGNDTVTEKYREIFTSDVIIELNTTPDEFKKYFDYKSNYKLAPGFKDANKDDSGVGDVIIWLTILQLGKEKNADIIFVTNEQKLDWYSFKDKDKEKSFIPKYELLDEYRRESNGKSINLLNFQDFLSMLNAKPETVKKVSQVSFEQQLGDVQLPEDLNRAFTILYPHEHLWELQREMWRKQTYLNTLSRGEGEISPELEAEINRENEILSKMKKAVDEEEKRIEDKKKEFIDYLKSLE